MNVKQLLGLLVLAPLLAGCTSSPDVHDVQLTKQYRGVGQLLSNPTFDGTGAPVICWLDASRKTVSLTTWDSGSCPSIPVGIRVLSSARVSLTMKAYSGACTSDLAPHTREFAMPSSVSRTKSVAFSLHVPGSKNVQKATLSLPAGQDVPPS